MCDSDDVKSVGSFGLYDAYHAGEDAYNSLSGKSARDAMVAESDKVAIEARAKEAQIAGDKVRINEIFGINAPGVEEARGAFDPRRPYALTEADLNKEARQKTLNSIYQDILGEQTSELDRQLVTKEADVKAMLAGRGISRSSVGQSIFDNLGYIYDKQEADFERGAKGAITNIEGADTKTRLGLIDMINAGGTYDDARQGAYENLDYNAEVATNEAKARNLTRLFAEMDELYGQKQYVEDYNRGQTYGSSNITTPGASSSGSSGSVINY